jgi:hypothetical protein
MLLVDAELMGKLAQPGWNRPTDIEDALAHCFAVRSREQAQDAYTGLLYATGNDHAGTYYPIVLAIFPAVRAILENGTAWAKYACVEALIDLCSSFEPQPGHEHVELPGEGIQLLRDALWLRARALVPLLEVAAENGDEASESCRELLAEIAPTQPPTGPDFVEGA